MGRVGAYQSDDTCDVPSGLYNERSRRCDGFCQGIHALPPAGLIVTAAIRKSRPFI